MSFQPATALAHGTVARGDHDQKHLLMFFHCTVSPKPKHSPLLGARDNNKNNPQSSHLSPSSSPPALLIDYGDATSSKSENRAK